MTNKKEISSILKKSRSLVDIFYYHQKNNPLRNIFFSKKENAWVPRNFLETKKKDKQINKLF